MGGSPADASQASMPKPTPWRLRNTDVFAAANFGLFLSWLLFAWMQRQRGYGTVGSVPEFLIYACSIVAVIGASWLLLRRRPCRTALLLLVEAGLVAHFAGAFVPMAGGRLYEQAILGLRYDTYVHLLNAFAGAAIIDFFLPHRISRPSVRMLIVTGLVLGAGSVVEIIEFLAFLTVPDAGVGGYENNMQDLATNLAGATAYAAAVAIGRSSGYGTIRSEAARRPV
jgi:hypothetical protein